MINKNKNKNEDPGKGKCITCRYAKQIAYPPGLGGETDGVHCSNLKVAEEQEATGVPDMLESYEKNGFVNLWRIEVISDSTCGYWEPGEGA